MAFTYIYSKQDIGMIECSPMARESYHRLKEWYLMPPCLTSGTIRVRIKGKVEQSREWSSAPPQHLSVVALEKRAFWSPSTTLPTLLILLICIYIYIMRERERGRQRQNSTFYIRHPDMSKFH